MQGINYAPTVAPLIAGAPSIPGLNSDRSIRSGDDPFRGGKAITPSDSTDVTATHRALWIEWVVKIAAALEVDVSELFAAPR